MSEFPQLRDLLPRYRRETRRIRSPHSRPSHSAERVDGQRMGSVELHPGTPGRQAISPPTSMLYPLGRSAVTNCSQIPEEVLFAGAGEGAHADGELRVPREFAESFTAPEMLAGDDRACPPGYAQCVSGSGRKPSSIACCRRQATPTACSPRERPERRVAAGRADADDRKGRAARCDGQAVVVVVDSGGLSDDRRVRFDGSLLDQPRQPQRPSPSSSAVAARTSRPHAGPQQSPPR